MRTVIRTHGLRDASHKIRMRGTSQIIQKCTFWLFQVETVLFHPPLLLPRQKQGELQPHWLGFLPRQNTRLSASALGLPSWRRGGGGRTRQSRNILCHVRPAPPHSGLYQHQHRRSTRIRRRVSVPTRGTTHKLWTVQLAPVAQSWSLWHFVPFVGWLDAPFPSLSGLKRHRLHVIVTHKVPNTRVTSHFNPSSHPPRFLTHCCWQGLKSWKAIVCKCAGCFWNSTTEAGDKKDYIYIDILLKLKIKSVRVLWTTKYANVGLLLTLNERKKKEWAIIFFYRSPKRPFFFFYLEITDFFSCIKSVLFD